MASQTATPRRFANALSGAGFGLTSGVLTTLGVVVGLSSGTDSRAAVAAGVITVAIADAFSDALGVHVAQESAGEDQASAWVAAGATFAAKLVFALTFLAPVLLLSLGAAVAVSIAWGIVLLTLFSGWVARRNGTSAAMAVAEHLGVAAAVLAASYGVGVLVDRIS